MKITPWCVTRQGGGGDIIVFSGRPVNQIWASLPEQSESFTEHKNPFCSNNSTQVRYAAKLYADWCNVKLTVRQSGG